MRKNGPRWETQVFTEIVPVLVLPDVIGASPGAELIKQWKTQGHDEGTVGAGDSNGEYIHVDLDTEKRLDHKVIDPEQHHGLNIVGVPFLHAHQKGSFSQKTNTSASIWRITNFY